MGNLRRIVGVGLAVALVAALAVYVLIPKTGPTANSVVVNQPQTPTNGGSGGMTSGGSGGTGNGGTDGGSTPSTPSPPVRPPKAHGQNSHGPKHVICLDVKNHPGNGVSQYQGANQYRGQCPAGSAQGAQGHGQHVLNADAIAANQDRTTFRVTALVDALGAE